MGSHPFHSHCTPISLHEMVTSNQNFLKQLNNIVQAYFCIPIVMVAKSCPTKLLENEILAVQQGNLGICQVFDIGWIWWPAVTLKALPTPVLYSFTVEWIPDKVEA